MVDYQKYLESIPKVHEEMIAELIQWVEINSGTDNLIGLSKMLGVLKTAFSRLGSSIEQIPLLPYSMINKEGHLTERPLGHALYLNKRPDAPIQVFLGGHYDTVFTQDSSFQQAERFDGHLLRGPGAADMKGGLVILLKSLETLEKSPFAERIGWHVLLNPDEEIGSPGSANILRKIAKKCRLGLIFEPCFSNGSFINARKGSINCTVVARGRSAHAGRDFHLGKNAISALSHFIIQAESLTDIDRGITINIGNIRGGGPLNIVPKLAICGLNIRMIHPEDVPIIKNALNRIVSDLNSREGFSLILHENGERPPKPFDQKQQALFQALKSCGEELGQEIKWQSSGGVTDGNLLFEEGLPNIDSLGVLGGEIHTHDEYVDLNSLVDKSCLVSLFLMKLSLEEI